MFDAYICFNFPMCASWAVKRQFDITVVHVHTTETSPRLWNAPRETQTSSPLCCRVAYCVWAMRRRNYIDDARFDLWRMSGAAAVSRASSISSRIRVKEIHRRPCLLKLNIGYENQRDKYCSMRAGDAMCVFYYYHVERILPIRLE